MTTTPLRVLCLEDSVLDAELITLELQRDGIAHTLERVDTGAGFREALRRGGHDLILADYSLPGFDGLTALAMVRSGLPDIPFIFVSGNAGEDIAIDAVKSGATDYVLKQRLTRLGPVVRRAVREAHERRERRSAERALQETERRQRLMVQHLKDYAIVFLDPGGCVVNWNVGAERILGQTEQQALGRHVRAVVHEGAEDVVEDWLRRVAGGEDVQAEVRLSRPDATAIWAEILLASVRDEDGSLSGNVMIVRDITERRHTQERAVIAQRMESTATVVGGIAHEFSNILNNVLGFATLIKKYIHDHARALKYAQAIEQSVQRGDEVTQRLLAFSRLEKRSPESLCIGALLDEVAGRFRQECPEGITVQRKGDDLLPRITGVRAELAQALANLLTNARDAILLHAPSGGRGVILLETSRTKVTEDLAPALGLAPGVECVTVRVTDTGIGIRQEIADRIFDPFFTTKEPGRGTGLGLSIVYTVVRGHRGVVLVDSTPGKGSTFSVHLPALDPRVDGHGRNGNGAGKQAELILLVDDELAMIEFGREILLEHGYRVLTARDGHEALAIYREQHANISMVILDLILPGLDGGQTYLAMKRINRNLRAMFCSGYTSDQLISSLLEEERLRAVRKPFQIEEFLSAVRETLDAGSQESSPSSHPFQAGG